MFKTIVFLFLIIPLSAPAAPADKIKSCYKKVVGEKVKKKISKSEIAKIKECIKK